jgi:hypothetical protein
MRDKRFIAIHRGGHLTKERHRQLIKWARECSEHVLDLFGDPIDRRLINALKTAKGWEKGNASVGDARKTAVEAHTAARQSSNPISASVARSVGHAVATAHMADHSPGAADYALKAVKLSGKSIEIERKWQDDQLPVGIKKLVLSARARRHLKI